MHDVGVTGLILAGGRGTRLAGRDKGWVSYRGRPLIEHVFARLQPQVSRIVISANRTLERYRALGVPVITDGTAFGEFAGPLAGIHAALCSLTAGWMAVVPCDAPALAPDLVARLAQGAPRAAVAVAAARVQPLFCLLHVDLAGSLGAYLARGERKAEGWLQEIGARHVAFEDAAAFANINTTEDLGIKP